MRQLFRLLTKQGRLLWLACPALLLSGPGSAQSLEPFGAAYFQDQYLMNPAMAAPGAGAWDLYAGYRRQWLSVPDGPANQFATGAYGLNGHVGLGLNLYNDQAGLIKTTRVMGTYAYHVQLDGEKQRLLFGLSAGVLSRRVDNSAIVGDPSDMQITKFNDHSTRFDADFGATYTDGKLSVQAALPAIASDLRKGQPEDVARTILFTALAWRFTFNRQGHGLALTPKFCYRATKGYDNIVDAGADLSVHDGLLDVFGLYHTTGNTTFGVGVNVKKTLAITAVYLTPSSSLSSYSHGSFGVSVGVNIGAGEPKTQSK